MTRGLPVIDTPSWMRDPRPCGRCAHSFYAADDEEQRYLRCGRAAYSQQCRYERHETGACGPAAVNWAEKFSPQSDEVQT